MASPGASEQPAAEAATERMLAGLLRVGVLLAAGFVLLGGIVFLARHGAEHPDYSRFGGEPEGLKSVGGVTRAALALRSRGLIQFGILILLATPVVRVAVSLVTFVRERDRLYAGLTAVVLLILLLSISGAVP
jgi:uncharacterized membrane protein